MIAHYWNHAGVLGCKHFDVVEDLLPGLSFVGTQEILPVITVELASLSECRMKSGLFIFLGVCS